jgi:predicted transposase/invertase (TIGR01784 family)
MATNIHDSGYKKLLSNHTIFRQLIKTFIREDWVNELDFDQCETLDKSFISDHYKQTESDLIYKVKVRGKTIYIYILLEFQSSVDRFMVVRVLNYITNFYLDYVATHRRIKKLPAIFPVVLYNGKKKWTAVQEIADLIEAEPALGQYALHFQYLLLNEKSYSRQHLLAIRNIVSTLFLAEAHYDIKLLEAELLNLYEREEDKQAVSLFLNWFRQLALYGKVLPEDYGKLDYIYRTKEEVQTMLAATLEQERKKVYQAGRKAGKEEGKAETQRQTIEQLLHFRFELTEANQAKYTQQVARIQELQHLNDLVNTLLNKATSLDDFARLVIKYLPADKPA